jgi:mannose/fructose/N-acetylgalactosamine-specific phosphotransferase system component IID
MYIVAIAWIYVALMMGVAEATNTNGTVLGGIVTFILYGILPTSIIIYIMDAPRRKKVRLAQEREASEMATSQNGNEIQANTPKPSAAPDPKL